MAAPNVRESLELQRIGQLNENQHTKTTLRRETRLARLRSTPFDSQSIERYNVKSSIILGFWICVVYCMDEHARASWASKSRPSGFGSSQRNVEDDRLRGKSSTGSGRTHQSVGSKGSPTKEASTRSGESGSMAYARLGAGGFADREDSPTHVATTTRVREVRGSSVTRTHVWVSRPRRLADARSANDSSTGMRESGRSTDMVIRTIETGRARRRVARIRTVIEVQEHGMDAAGRSVKGTSFFGRRVEGGSWACDVEDDDRSTELPSRPIHTAPARTFSIQGLERERADFLVLLTAEVRDGYLVHSANEVW
ncbi:hypothetical protein EXIGLDRAFT_706279 [Exidia glandulosa HHB12029]|uniref:Uncharacterized protein n=1 Tax=Exidia glandulosa HHB12029 TaxID=1314781 RepID=A0A165B5A0_EXIGL|nr:hypothetical protein EXIGLDRAFT_706279 [Exidia glandulosa HHB12029]